MPEPSRRQFLWMAAAATGGALLPAPLSALRVQTSRNGTARRSATCLDSNWDFRLGPLYEIWEVWRKEDKDLWAAQSLPHSFNGMDSCDPDRPYFKGQGWYRTNLAVANPQANGRTLLHFQGPCQTTTLWVGSTLIGAHKGGYDEFAFDITDAVASLPLQSRQSVPVAVLCDNSPDLDRIPSELSDFCLYGGLYRYVHLVNLPAVALDAGHVLPTVATDGSCKVTISGRLDNPANQTGPQKISIEILDHSGESLYHSDQALNGLSGMTKLSSFKIAQPTFWSPETPYLYRYRVNLSNESGETELEERFGVRYAEFVEHGPFKLNGKLVLLRGTPRHADHAGVAAAMSDEQVRHEMQLVKEIRANFIRLGHYQQDRLVLELCDELGLMVWEEVPWCHVGVGSPAFQQNAKDMLGRLIDQHYNHPSMVWGLGNEDDWSHEYPSVDKEAIRGFMTEMRDLAHSLDSSLLTSFRRCDFARDIPDVYSSSIWAGWYRGNYREYEKSLLTERGRVRRFLPIEWGADSHAGRHSEDPEAILCKVKAGQGTDERGLDYLKTGGEGRVSKDGDWSETYACDLFDWHLKTQEKLDWLAGSAQWIFKDFASPLRSDDGVPNVNQKGVVERDDRKKELLWVG